MVLIRQEECAQINKANTKQTQVLMRCSNAPQIYLYVVLGSIVVSIPACHAGDRGSIPRRGVFFFSLLIFLLLLQ